MYLNERRCQIDFQGFFLESQASSVIGLLVISGLSVLVHGDFGARIMAVFANHCGAWDIG
jgi:hypothetical protein